MEPGHTAEFNSAAEKANAQSSQKVSLIILCCNALEFTRRCLDSLWHHPRMPDELILVDNGSTDGTAAYLEKLRKQFGPERIILIRNDTNRGFPAACNQALALARGRDLVFLNNDTVVPAGWLEGLLAPTLADPVVGLVGAVSNYAADPQYVRAKYATPEELDAFASHRRQDYARRWLPARRLSSICLLVRRQVFERIGGWDERFGVGFFDDDDLCVRAGQAGFRLVVAQDVYVHHFGSQTFKALGLEVRQQLVKNAAVFRAKWEKALPAPEDTPAEPCASGPSAESCPARATLPARVSVCMIVKNEERNLGPCLESVTGLADEVVVVDTGSTDQTRAVALRHGARVFEFPWVDSFAAARNESLRHATGDWLFLLDADDRVDADNHARLRSLFARLANEMVAYVVKIRSRLDPAGKTTRLLDQVRIFPRHPELRWEYRVHEQIVPSLGRCGCVTRWTDIILDHTGYQDRTHRRRKLERNLKLLKLEQQEGPEDPFTLFNLGRTYLDLGNTAESVALFQRSLERSSPGLSIVRKLYALLACGHEALGKVAEAEAVCREGLARFPEDAELLFQHGVMLRNKGDLAAAEASLLHLVQTRPAAYFDMVDMGLRGYKARNQLALIHAAQGRAAEAETQWRAALAERPEYAPAWLGLGHLFLEQQRWAQLDEAAAHVELGAEDTAGQGVNAALLRARGCLARKEYGAARQLLEAVCGNAPRALAPRVTLSHVLLEEGRDWQAAEAVLRAILTLKPNHKEARHNLAVLLRKQRATSKP